MGQRTKRTRLTGNPGREDKAMKMKCLSSNQEMNVNHQALDNVSV
jgi:hypothetical protein